jgi:hypothetical protein
MKRWKKIAKWSLGVLVVALLLAQLVPVTRSNPPVEQEVTAPPEALAVLRRACYDCHSHQSEWPWYSYVAPVSWLVAHDVEEARDKLNFSTWNRLDEGKRLHAMEEIWEEVEEGEMPLWAYRLMHGEARLSAADLAALREWTAPARREGGHGGGSGHEHGDEDDDGHDD